MAKKDENKNENQNQSQEERTQAQMEQDHETVAAEQNAEQVNTPNYVEADAPKDEGKVRALATPEDEQVPPTLDNLPEPDSVGMLEHYNNPSPTAEAEKQQRENFPRATEATFNPADHSVEQARFGRADTHRSVHGRVIVLDEDQFGPDGEVYKAGTGDYPLEVADYFIEQGVAYEPAGKKRGR